MNLAQFGLILRARWRIILIAVLIGVGLASASALRQPKVYRATAQLLINIHSPDTVGSVAEQGAQFATSGDYLNTQMDVIRSDRVAIGAVKRLGLENDPGLLQAYREAGSPGDPIQFMANAIRGGLQVSASNSSRVISISYVSENPGEAARMANTFAQAYRDVSLDLQTEPAQQSAGWFERNAANLRSQLAAAQSRLSTRRAELGLTASVDQADTDDVRLGALSSALAGAQAAQAAASARTGGGALPDVMANPVIAGFDSDIARLEAQRQQLATFAGPNNPDYKSVVAQIATLRAQRARQQALVAQTASATSSQSGQNVASLQAQVNAQKARVMASQRARGEVAALEQDVANLRSTYEQLVAKQSQTNLLGASTNTNVSILSPAAVPLSPIGLSRGLKVMAGLVLSFIVGVLLAFGLEFFDQRLRTAEDATTWLGIPNLGGVRAIERSVPRIGRSPMRYLPRSAPGSSV